MYKILRSKWRRVMVPPQQPLEIEVNKVLQAGGQLVGGPIVQYENGHECWSQAVLLPGPPIEPKDCKLCGKPHEGAI